MPHEKGAHSRAIRIALIEPNEADAYWFYLITRQAKCRVDIRHYPTGMTALKEWEKGGQSDFDLVVVADLLPMLSLREFVEAAQDFQPHAEVVVTGEVTTAPELRLDGYSFCPKPLCIQDLVNFVRGKRRDLIQAPYLFCARDGQSASQTQ